MSIRALLRRYNPTKLCDGAQMAIIWVLHFQRATCSTIQTMHSKFALRSHHVWKYGRHPISNRCDWARNKPRRRRRKKEDKNIMSASATQGGHNNECYRTIVHGRSVYSSNVKHHLGPLWRVCDFRALIHAKTYLLTT